jgi:catechol 2,3-dioxygenase-like lactoylglutathione lyase family enzyme
MLGGKDAAATIAVSDLERARDFYAGTLGLESVQDQPGGRPL